MKLRSFQQITTILLLTFLYGNTIVLAGQYIPSERFSSGLINDLCQDKYGFMWVATDFGLNQYDGYRFTEYIHHPEDSTTISSNVVGCLYCDRDGRLWVGTSKGLDRYDYATNEFVHYPFPKGIAPRVSKMLQRKDGTLLIGTSGYNGLYALKEGKVVEFSQWTPEFSFVNSMLEDDSDRFWMCGFGNELVMHDGNKVEKMMSTEGFVVDFAEYNGEVLVFALHGIMSYRDGKLLVADIDQQLLERDNIIIRRVFKDAAGNIFIGTRGHGLFLLPYNKKTLVRMDLTANDIDMSSAKIWAITEDRNGNFWLGCQSKGLVMLQSTPPLFQSWRLQYQGEALGSTITSLCEGNNGHILCTVQGNGVFEYDSRGRIVSHQNSPTTSEYIFRDRLGHYWIGTNDALYAYNPQTGTSARRMTFDCDKFNAMTDDGHGTLYISTFSKGFCAYNTQSGETRWFHSGQKDAQRGSLCNNWVMAMMTDHHGCIWLATSAGVSCYDPKADSFQSLGWHALLDGTMCYSLCETSRGDILIGTANGLYIYEPGMKEATLFREGHGLSHLVIGYIAETKNGDIWCSTSSGLWQYNAEKRKFVNHVSDNGLTGKEYINGVGMITNNRETITNNREQRLFFVNNDGIITFQPINNKRETITNNLSSVNLTAFLIAGHPVNTRTESNGRQVTSGPVITTDHYCVSYLDNSITLEFSLLDYTNPRNIIFEYRINGGEWIQNQPGQNAIPLTHLQPGRYILQVRALSAGVYSDIKEITIRVTPPWYQSFWAYLIYILIIIGLLGYVIWAWRRRTRRQLDEEKMQFLMNATHDIRSPLTLIMGPLTKLKQLVVDGEGKNYIDTIDRNAKRMMLLVNQILDERRIDKKQLQLHCRETNMVDFIGNICKLYQYNANQRNITFAFEHEQGHVTAWIDRINFDKVINNLLSNAFKFTFDGGEVKVVLSETEKDIVIDVTDNGVGLKSEDAHRLFDRFYQGRNSDVLGIQGTGIGLNLSRSITQLHGGTISARNLQQGASFRVTLPKGNAHLQPEQILTETREMLSTGNGSKQQFRPFRILIADDDPEIADYIIGELGSHYKFDQSSNGKEALKTLLTGQYDLVVSDVMMPEMDGITLLKRIKDNPQISQIPVILLTSKSEVEHKLEGLKFGADAYIAKPFNMEELHIQIDNLIDNVRRLRGKFSGAVQQEDRVENIEVKGNDDALMDRIMRSVNAHMSETDFNVDTLAEDVGISRAQLHRKMKEITGISSGKFLRNLRMEQAARLLREGRINISQVADRVGYNDQAHFSTAFKNHFGMSPSEYAEANKEK